MLVVAETRERKHYYDSRERPAFNLGFSMIAVLIMIFVAGLISGMVLMYNIRLENK